MNDNEMRRCAGNLQYIDDTAMAVCALGNLMGITDVTKLDDTTLRGLGLLLDKLGVVILDSAYQCREAISKQSE